MVFGILYLMIILNLELDLLIGFSWYIGISCWGGVVGWVRKEKVCYYGLFFFVRYFKYIK